MTTPDVPPKEIAEKAGEMLTGNALDQLVLTLAEKDRLLEEAEAALTLAKMERSSARQALSTAMAERQTSALTVCGHQAVLKSRFCASRRADIPDDQMLGALRAAGLGGLIRDSYAPVSLEASLRELWKEQQEAAPGADPMDAIPAALRDKVSITVLTEVSLRRKRT